VSDEESERAVSRWVRLGDQVTGRPSPDERAECARCGSTDNVMDRGDQARCARCYLESGAVSVGPEGWGESGEPGETA
jgi:hypothetical protein